MDLTPSPLVNWLSVLVAGTATGVMLWPKVIGPGSQKGAYILWVLAVVIGGLVGGVFLAWLWPLALFVGCATLGIYLLGSGLYRIDKARRARRG